MGLFDIFAKRKEKKEFHEIIIETSNVNEELLKLSKEYEVPLSSLDFEILEVKTYIKTEEHTEYVLLDEISKMVIENEKWLLNPENDIMQKYKIIIKRYVPQSGFEIIGDIKVNEYNTFAEYIVFPNSDLSHFTEIRFLEEMNKKKVRNSLLINLLDEPMKEDVSKFAKVVEYGKFEKPQHIRLCRGIDPIPSQEGKVIYHYKKQKQTLKKELIYPIKEGEVLIEILKPKEGRNGRDCRGKIILMQTPKDFEIPNIEYDMESIHVKEEEDKILYIAAKNGYVIVEDGKYIIKDELAIRQINLKTGDVHDADKADVKLEVSESSALKEAIGDNMSVETKELIVRGNVGNKAHIKAQNLEVDGQTHKNSVLISKIANLNVHKGHLTTETGIINSLEGGEVRAKKIEIKRALGGVVIAEEVIIHSLYSHVHVYALNKITIKDVKGYENHLSINPKKVLDDVDIEKMEKKIDEIRQHINYITKEAKKIKEILDKNKHAYKDLKELYLEEKKRGKVNPTVFKKLKEYQTFQKKYKTLVEKIDKLKEERKILEERIDNIQNAVYNAKIISHSPWMAYNRIEFDLLHPPIKLVYDTKGDEGVCGFKLKDYGNKFKIVKIKVKNDSGS
ncbi:MAG: DUF342 domain-containing protein [Epsilonproteobacteria bacterium]|nr:DUF342 domain-containing protein [Campylobacterota bacterium]